MGTVCRLRLIVLTGLLSSVLVSIPAAAQVDFSGEWAPRIYEDQPERVPGPYVGDYLALPISEAARLRADVWQSGMFSVPEWQCRPYQVDYIALGISPLTITKEDPLTREVRAYHTDWQRTTMSTVYVDGRPHPDKDALSSWGGFATGKWEGDMLTITITNLKEGILRRNGLPRGASATVTEHWIRHGEFLTVVIITNDPVYLTEPLIRSVDYQLDVRQRQVPYPCEMVNELDRPKGFIPHYLPGTNPDLEEIGEKFGIPSEVMRGGAEATYPDYRKKLKQLMGPFPTAKPLQGGSGGGEP